MNYTGEESKEHLGGQIFCRKGPLMQIVAELLNVASMQPMKTVKHPRPGVHSAKPLNCFESVSKARIFRLIQLNHGGTVFSETTCVRG